LGQILDTKPVCQVGANMAHEFGKAAVSVLHVEQGGELRLASGTPVVHDQLLRRAACNEFAEVLGDKSQ
jgi:hypothetical protein